ncbi:cytoskeleton protein RodZ [Vibrio sinaloensis]|uniref:cytoskeleton protein RodZ n=1 Tax=Photobacterium sp. (strain ATCC 43367) TaxID=379097 RepID=UPI00057CB4F0|nr:cytoskeleton protein RodZ [Vibrio sinaloensis]KHT46138.1 transcriptional regulator [Vibrio sinaloensis]
MTADKDMTAPEQTQSAVEAGTLLKQKREQLGLSQKQIADRLRLRVSIIESIESNQFTTDLVATFTKGYLRSYAKAVGLDESEVLAAYAQHNKVETEEQPMQSFSRQTKREKHDSRIMIITWGILLVIVGISSVWWWQNQQSSIVDLTEVTEQELELEQQLENAQMTELPASIIPEVDHETELNVVEEPILQEPAEEVAASETMDTVQETAQQEQATPAEEIAEVAEPVEESVPQVAANLLVMTFEGDCWIQVKDKSGKTVSTGVKKAGETLELSGELPYKLVLGAPENVSMTLASEPVDLSGYTSGKVARFTLP